MDIIPEEKQIIKSRLQTALYIVTLCDNKIKKYWEDTRRGINLIDGRKLDLSNKDDFNEIANICNDSYMRDLFLQQIKAYTEMLECYSLVLESDNWTDTATQKKIEDRRSGITEYIRILKNLPYN